MEVTKQEQALIHEVMLMAYEQGIEEGMKRAVQIQNGTYHSHNPKENVFTKSLANYEIEREYDKEDWRMP